MKPKHKGPHCAGLCEGQAYITRIAELEAERDNWIETAKLYQKNEEYYRGLLVKCGESIGSEAYISDDGSVQEDVLCAKIPELVAGLFNKCMERREIDK